jgi:hypothetical protein
MIGLSAYSLLPNIHQSPIERAYKVPTSLPFRVNPGSLSETPENISIVPDGLNQLKVNITVFTVSGELTTIQFKLFSEENHETCSVQNTGCLVSKSVTNDSITLPVKTSSRYYFLLDNTASPTPKNVSLSITLVATTTQTTSSRDGPVNLAGLGVGFVGFLVTVYGLARKTVIPWE